MEGAKKAVAVVAVAPSSRRKTSCVFSRQNTSTFDTLQSLPYNISETKPKRETRNNRMTTE